MHGPRLTRVRWALPLALGTLLSSSSSVAQDSVATHVIEFETYNRNAAGVVRCGLFKQGGWLKDAFRAATVKINGKKALCVFKEVPAGTYGISAFHDENNDGNDNARDG